MVERVPNEIKMVAWFMAAKNVIKFANDDTTYKLGEAVIKASNFEKFPLNKGDKVEVGLKEGVVTFLRKQKSDAIKDVESYAKKQESHGSEEAYEPTPEEEAGTVAPAPEVKKEEPKVETVSDSPAVPTKVLTVFACAANKKVVKFLELKDDGWFQISEDIQKQDYATIGLVARNKVLVTFNDKTVISLVKVASEPAEQAKTTTSSPVNAKVEPTAAPTEKTSVSAPKKEWKPFQSKDDYWAKKSEFDQAHYDVKESEKQLSIEAQAAVNSANEVAGKVAASISPAPTANVINNMIRAIAESNFALIQELKKK